MNQPLQIFFQKRWPDGLQCPFCFSVKIISHGYRSRSSDYHYKRYHCSRCKRFFSEITGTFLEKSKLSFELWMKGAKILMKTTQREDPSSIQSLAKELRISYPTALRISSLLGRAFRAKKIYDITKLPYRSSDFLFADLLYEI